MIRKKKNILPDVLINSSEIYCKIYCICNFTLITYILKHLFHWGIETIGFIYLLLLLFHWGIVKIGKFQPITNGHIQLYVRSMFKAANYKMPSDIYLVDSAITIQRPMKIFQSLLNNSYKEYPRANHTSTYVNILI